MNLNDLCNRLATQGANGMSVPRSGIVQDDAKEYPVTLESLRVTGTGAVLGTAAGTPSGAFGMTVGTFGTNSPKVVGEAAAGNSKTNRCRFLFPLPPEYVAGESVAVRVRCKEAVGVATVATSIDCECYEADKDAGVSADLCATAAQDVTNVAGNKDFTITTSNLGPGDVLDVQLTGVTNDTGGNVGTVLTITNVALLLDVKS